MRIMNMPLHLITANDIENWAQSLAARSELARVIADLIRASAPDLRYYRFPNGDASQTHGFDGYLETTKAVPFVPAGKSIWEFGTSASAGAKLKKDYEKRTQETTPEQRAEHHFVFVTPQILQKEAQDYELERKRDGWLSVQVLDANALSMDGRSAINRHHLCTGDRKAPARWSPKRYPVLG